MGAQSPGKKPTMSTLLWSLVNPLQYLCIVFWTIVWILIALVARLVTGNTDLSLAMARRAWAPPILWICGSRLSISGLERLTPGQSVFFAVNHQSMIDVPSLYAALPMPLLFVLKEELGRIPIFGTFVRAMGMVLIKRQARRQAVQELLSSSARLPESHCLVAFPEGTRGNGEDLLPFKPGVFVPAIDAQIAVVPIALDGPARQLPKGTMRLRPGKVRLAIGEPIPTRGLERADRRQLAQEVEEAVRGLWSKVQAKG
jgi:1-acyl-sn-glycerol-3-phosphate acyltransferase